MWCDLAFVLVGIPKRTSEAIRPTCATIHLFAEIDHFIDPDFIQSLEDDDDFALSQNNQLA